MSKSQHVLIIGPDKGNSISDEMGALGRTFTKTDFAQGSEVIRAGRAAINVVWVDARDLRPRDFVVVRAIIAAVLRDHQKPVIVCGAPKDFDLEGLLVQRLPASCSRAQELAALETAAGNS